MIALHLSDAAQMMGGRLLGADAPFSGVSTDSRKLLPLELFFALCGPHFDGHEHVAAAFASGAAAAVVARRLELGGAQILVDDPRLALGRLAQAWRARMSARVLALTGSNGKTTVKQMTAAMLSPVAPTLATEGNLNNDIGVPLTLLRLSAEHRFAVIEMGANHAGEIDYLSRLARPDVALVNNAMAAHLEGFGSLDGVAMAKGEIYGGLADSGIALINADDRYADLWRRIAGARLFYTFGFAAGADLRGERIADAAAPGGRLRITGPRDFCVELRLPLPGEHNARNALAAAALALSAGADGDQLRVGLESLAAVPGRLEFKRAACGAQLIDDSYNANPDSLRAALAVLAEQPLAAGGERWLALGDMGELGEEAPRIHARMGALVRESGVARLFAAGPLAAAAADAFGAGASQHADAAAAAAAIGAELHAAVCLLVKGSRAAGMEDVVAALCAPGARERAG